MGSREKRSFSKAAALAGIADVDEFLRQEYKRISWLCRRRLQALGPARDEKAADIVQLIFKKFLEHIGDSALQANPRGWLTTVAKNNCTDAHREYTDRQKHIHPSFRSAGESPAEAERATRKHRPPATTIQFAHELAWLRNEEGEKLEDGDPFEAAMDNSVLAPAREDVFPGHTYDDYGEWLGWLTPTERAVFLLRQSAIQIDRNFLEGALDKKTLTLVLKAKRQWLHKQNQLDRDEAPPNMPAKVIACYLRMPEGTVRSHLTRATDKLWTHLRRKRWRSTKSPPQVRLGRRLRERSVFVLNPTSAQGELTLRGVSDRDRDRIRWKLRRDLPVPRTPFTRSEPPNTFSGDRFGRLHKKGHTSNSERLQGKSERPFMRLCGGYYKGCMHCGTCVKVGSRKSYESGYKVFKSYDPNHDKWLFRCDECGALDNRCWENFDEHIWKRQAHKLKSDWVEQCQRCQSWVNKSVPVCLCGLQLSTP